MRSTFRVLFYTKNQSIKNGKVPVMGRITINKTTACFSCKKEYSPPAWHSPNPSVLRNGSSRHNLPDE